jgi:hypothetical protein
VSIWFADFETPFIAVLDAALEQSVEAKAWPKMSQALIPDCHFPVPDAGVRTRINQFEMRVRLDVIP